MKVVKKSGYDNGYNDAIEEIKKRLQGGQSGQGGGEGEVEKPEGMNEIPIQNQGSGNSNKQNKSGNGNKQKPAGANEENTGKVQPQDATDMGRANNQPAGGLMDDKQGKEITKEEGYRPDTQSSDSEKFWEDTVIKNMNNDKLWGKNGGNFKSTVMAQWRTNTEWKKELRKIVGQSISKESRSAFANKNVLVSQNRIARTEKDKYDNVDFIAAFIDSSGSLTDDQLRLILSEIYQVALAKKPVKLVVIQCDTRITDVQVFSSVPELKKYMQKAEIKGRGGTDLHPCWDYLKENFKRRCDLVMCFTDGEFGDWPVRTQNMKYLWWCIIDNPSKTIPKKDYNTGVIYLNSSDIK